MASATGEGPGQGQEVHGASSRSPTDLEQVGDALCWDVEGAHQQQRGLESVDWDVLELAQVSSCGAGTSP